MIRTFTALALCLAAPALAQNSLPPIPVAGDALYPDRMQLHVDATDLDRRILRVKQIIPTKPGHLVLLMPEWLPGNHAPRGQIEKLAGLKISTGNTVLEWRRDPYDVYAFHVDVPAGAKHVVAEFQFLSATDEAQGRVVMTDAMMNIQWEAVSLYPAGYATKNIPVTARVTYPTGWKAATALRPHVIDADSILYYGVDYQTLVDSPVFAGKHFRAEPLGQNVTLNIVADEAKNLVIKPEQLDAHKRLVDQSIKLFGTRQFDHYDFLLALTDKMGGIGLEHHRSSENGVNPEYFTDWDAGPGRRNLLPHEFTHSWDGKHRRPAGQMVPDFKTPLENSLLWVYEGQTQFWGYVLGARSGLFSKQDTLDALASIAANLDVRRARDWRALVDTTYDPIITARRPKGWVTWQRSEDYYNEGLLIWLEADALIRQKTAGVKGLDDFARAFFGTKEGDWTAKGYDLADVVRTLNTVVAHDWDGFLKMRITEKAAAAPLNGFANGGYKLTYAEVQTPFLKDVEKRAKTLDLTFSLGGSIAKSKITSVVWDGPMFSAGLAIGMEIIAVNGISYSDDVLKDAITAAKGTKDAIRLIVKSGDRVKELPVIWNGGLRYPKLEKVGVGDGSLDRLLMAK